MLLSFNVILLLFVIVRAGDLAISSALAKDTIRALCYGAVALLALVAVILMLVGR